MRTILQRVDEKTVELFVNYLFLSDLHITISCCSNLLCWSNFAFTLEYRKIDDKNDIYVCPQRDVVDCVRGNTPTVYRSTFGAISHSKV